MRGGFLWLMPMAYGLWPFLACSAPSLPYAPPDFEGVSWPDGAPDLRGKVALVRWWTQG